MLRHDPAGGTVDLELRCVAGRISEVRLASQRPSLAPLLAGRPVDTVAQLIGVLHAICARAQSVAAAAAIAAARGQAVNTHCDTRVREEAVAELILAVLRDGARELLAEARRLVHDPDSLAGLLEHQLLGVSAHAWLRIESFASLRDWCLHNEAPLARACAERLTRAEPARAGVAKLLGLDAAHSLDLWPRLTPSFATRPTRGGQPAETGAVARLAPRALIAALEDRPLLQRWVARLTEIAMHATRDPALSCGLVSALAAAPGRGRAAVESARGTLLHEATISGERVIEYTIVAPTEWNFHPDGPLRQWLHRSTVGPTESARELAERAAQALDPCVDLHIEVR